MGDALVYLKEYGNYPDLTGVKKVLVIIFKNIGDVVLSSPVYTALKKELPQAKIDVVVNSGTEAVLMGNPAINKIHLLSRTPGQGVADRLRHELKLISSIRAEKYDLSIALSTGERSRNLGLFSGAGIRVGIGPGKSKKLLGKPMFTVSVQQAPGGRHYVERNLDCLRKMGIFPEGETRLTTFYEGEEAKARTQKMLVDNGINKGDPYILFHPTSRWMFKCWPYEKAAELIDRLSKELNAKVVLTSGPDSMELIYMKHVMGSIRSDVADLSGKLSLRDLGALIRNANMFLGVDSAPMHIAAAVRTPVVVLFGPSDETDWGPWGEGHKVITSDQFTCRPCNRDGCGGSKWSECMEKIEVEMVFQNAKGLLGLDQGH